MEHDPRMSEAGVTTPRAVGRIVLASLLALAVAMVVLPLGLSFAQTTPTIEIVNPNDTSSNQVSDAGGPYEITAWLSEVPENPFVEFQIKDADGAIVVSPLMLVASPTAGDPATWETDWDIPDDFEEGTYSLEAILYSNYTGPGTGTASATATQEIVVNAQDDELLPGVVEEKAETAAITYPVNGGMLGVNVLGDGTATFLLRGTASEGTETVEGFYTLSAKGTDPEFVGCGSAAPGDAGAFTIRCAVAEGDFPLDITGVAARADKALTPLPVDDVVGASDGHSVTSYHQRPTTLTLNPEQAGNTSVGTCQLFTVNVLDQSNHPIAGTNVDVHAQGPDEALKFDVGAGFTDENQPPDQNHTSTEPGVACAEDGSSAEAGEAGTQGTDPVAGEPSRKHVESVDGTDDEGNWTFALHSAANGNTQVAAWADFDEDDQHCADEAQDHSSIGWGVPAPAVAPQPAQVEECAVADPSPSPTASPTDASPTASPTDSPSPTVSPSPDPEPTMWLRTITIGFKHPKNNNKLRVKGRVKAEAGAPNQCTSNTTVRIQKKVKGNWKGRGKTQTNGKGFYKRNVKDATGRYRATAVRNQVSEMDTCRATRKAKNHKHR